MFWKRSYLSFIDMLVDLTSFFLLMRRRASPAVAASSSPLLTAVELGDIGVGSELLLSCGACVSSFVVASSDSCFVSSPPVCTLTNWHKLLLYAVVTTTIRLRFDGRSTAYQWSFGWQWWNASLSADPLAAVYDNLFIYLFRPQCSRPHTDRPTVVT